MVVAVMSEFVQVGHVINNGGNDTEKPKQKNVYGDIKNSNSISSFTNQSEK